MSSGRRWAQRAQAFFDRYGPRSIVLTRFVPMVRTFTPIVAGAGRMGHRTFGVYNVIGGALWGTGVTVLGALLGRITFVRNNIELILVGVVLVSLAPIAVELIRARRRARRFYACPVPATATRYPAPRTVSITVRPYGWSIFFRR